MASPHATFLKATKLKLNQEERLANNAIINICRAKYTADDIAEGSNIDTAFLYDQVQGKLRRSVNPKILIVMKSRLQAGAFAQILRRHGCDVIVATNGHKAYTSYLRKDSADFSLCLCQWYLPGIAGRDLAYYEAESGGRLPFVALLGHNQRATDAIRSGADLFLKLPLFPHLRSILSLVLPHTSAMAQFRVGAMQSNFEGMRRLLSTQQDVLRHTVETNTLMELVKSDLASVSEISSVEVGMNMLEAVMASIRMQEATSANLAASRKNPTEVLSAQKRSSKKNTRKSLKANSTPEPDSTFDEPAPTHDAQFHALATSFRNVMLVLNRVRNSLISTQQENHALREKSSRSVEQAELLRGQLRSFGVDVIDAKLERLYLPRRLTRSPPPRDSSEAFHANIENDPDVDVTTFSKQDLMRALRSAKAAITSSNDEISELMEDLQHLQDYQIEVEDDLIHSGMAVHFNIGVRDEDASKNRSGKIGDDALKTLVRKRSQSRVQDNEAGGRLLRTLSMLGPRLQDEFIRQQSVADDVSTASIDESRDQESVGARTPLQLKSEPKRRGFSSPVAAPFVVSSDGEFHIQRSKKKKEEVSKVFFARRFFWTAHVLQALESQCMSNEDARQVASSKVVRPVPPVPKCLEKPNPVVTNAIEGVVNGVIALHNQLALQVNTCTAKVGATFPTASQSLRDLSIGVKDALQGFNVSQHVTALQLHVEGVITKMIGAERELWNNERFEMEKYKLQNPPGSRKLIADLRGTVRELRLRRWRDWFQTIETKVRANYLRKWIVWFLHRQGEKTWKSKSKQLEIEMQSTNTKKVAEQVAFARKQSVDVLAKQSQQRVDYEQLQIKHMRVSQLYDEAKLKTAAVTIENETLVAQVASLSEKKDNLEAKVCEKTDEIVRLMQSVGPLEEELMVARTTLEDRDQKNLSLQAQVSAYHRKVQQLSNKGSFLGLPQPKATQTAISNANSALLLDNIVKTLGARQFSNSFDMSTLERKLSGSGSAFTVTLPDADEFFSSHPLMDSDDEEPSANNDEILSSPNSMRGGPDASQKVPEVQQPSKQAPKPSPKKTLVGTGKGRSKSVTSIPIARQGKQTQSMRMPSRTMSISSAMESSLNPPNHLGSSKNSTRSSVSPSSEAASKFTRTPSTSHSNSPQTKDLVLGGNVDRFESRSPTPPPINGFKPSDESFEGAGCPPPEAATLRDNDDPPSILSCAPSDRDHSEVFPLDQRPADVEFDEVPSRTDASMQSEKVPVGKKPRKTKSVSALPVSSFDTSSGVSSPNHLNVPRKRAVSLSGSFASDASGAHISAQGSGEYAESIPASILASTESPHQRAGNQTRVLPPSPLVSNGSMLFDSPQVLFVDQSQSAMSLPLMVAVGVQSSFTDASIFLPPALTESISNVQHAGGSLRISPQASPKTSPRTISGQPHVTEEFPDSVHPNAAQNRTSLDMSDTSRWQSALRDLARSRTSVAAAATSPTSLTAINSGIGNVVDSTRRLLEAMSIPQNVLVKTTSPAEMLDSLCSVLEAAFAAVTSNQSRVHGYTSNNTSMRSVPSPSAPPGTSPDAAAGRSRAASIYTKKTDQHESSSHLPNIAETPRGRVVPLHKDASRTVLSSDQRDALPPIFERKPPTTKPSSTSISPQENVIHRVDPAMYRSHLDGDNNDGVSKPSPRSATVQLQPQQVETREKKQREKERKAAQTNIAVLLQREMLRRPAPVNSSEQNGLSPHPPTETLSPLQPRGSRRAL